MASTNKALVALPNDAMIHEFRALVEFALSNYKEAATGLYSVLSVGPGWDWTTLISLYPNVDVYTKQLRTAEAYLKQHPDADDVRFVVVYHYLTMGSTSKTAAIRELKKLHEDMPQDKLFTELLAMTGGPEAVGVTPPPAESAAKQAPAVPATALVGKWSAAGQNDTKFALGLTGDGNFTWTYTHKGKDQTVKGVYAMDANVLAMEPETGGTMLAEVTVPKDGAFDFKLLGTPPSDPGLKFAIGH